MTLSSFLLMRQEIMLIIIALLVLVAEITVKDGKKAGIIPFALILFAIHTIVGFLPAPTGTMFGGMFHNTAMTILMKNILNIGVLIILIQSVRWLKNDENSVKIPEYFILILSTLIGMYFMISSGDFLMFYIGLETATIPIAALAAYERLKNKSAEAGVKLILSSALSSGILLYGVSMIYGTTGSIYFSQIANAFSGSGLQSLAFIFFFAGMAFKIAIVPFHLWTPDVYEGSPMNVTSYLSVISKGAAVFIFVTILYTVFSQPAMVQLWQDMLFVLSLTTMTVGNLFAIRQKNIKRFLAFSSIAQAGFILLGIMGNSGMGLTSVVYFVLIYIFSNLGAFGVAGIISEYTGKEMIDDYNGLYRTNPRLSLTMMLSLFSLAGIPPVAGFFGKFFLFAAAAQEGYYLLVLFAVLNTIISLYYYLLVVKAMFINKSDNPIAPMQSDFYSRLGLILCMIGVVVVGLASPIWDYIKALAG